MTKGLMLSVVLLLIVLGSFLTGGLGPAMALPMALTVGVAALGIYLLRRRPPTRS